MTEADQGVCGGDGASTPADLIWSEMKERREVIVSKMQKMREVVEMKSAASAGTRRKTVEVAMARRKRSSRLLSWEESEHHMAKETGRQKVVVW